MALPAAIVSMDRISPTISKYRENDSLMQVAIFSEVSVLAQAYAPLMTERDDLETLL